MNPLLFPNSFGFSHRGFDIELVPEGCRLFTRHLESIREEVLRIATYSRGWNDQKLEHMRAHFKLGPLYDVNALVLIRKSNVLFGLAGSVNDWHVEQGSLLHLCSLGLLPEAQRRGFVPVLLAIVWLLAQGNLRTREDFQNNRAFVTAITQSPYLYAMLHRLFDLYPSPEHPIIPADIRKVAQAVVHRFDENLRLDEERLILRNECSFFYQRVPYSFDRKLNSFCDRNLDYGGGDVFVLVGRVIPEKVERHVALMAEAHPELFGQFRTVLEKHVYKVFDQSETSWRAASHAKGPL